MTRYAINYAARGYIFWQNSGEKPFKIPAPVMWWQLPENHYRYGCYDGAPWEHRYVSFSGSRAESYARSSLLPSSTINPFLQLRDPERATKTFDELLNYLAFPKYGTSRAVQLLEGVLLLLHEQRYAVPPDRPYAKGIKSLCLDIDAHPEKTWDFHKEAKLFHLSYSRFRAVFKGLMGFAPHDYLVRSRIRKAAGLLRQHDGNIEKIAEQVGINDLYYFSRLFKLHQGLSPSSYRKQFILPGTIHPDEKH